MNKSNDSSKSKTPFRILANVLLGIVPLIAFSFQLNGGWRFDDAHHLLFLSNYHSFEYFYDFGAARMQSGSHFTPFNIFTYDLANRLFTMERRYGWYLLHLTYLGISSILLFNLLAEMFDVFSAFFSALIFALGFPIAAISGQLMVGHYILGLCFALAAIFLCRPDDPDASSASVIFYFLACLSKEIYFPFSIFIALRFKRLTFKKIFPYFLAGSLFLILRFFVIDQIIGGYGKKASLFQSASELFYGLIGIFFQSNWHTFLIFLVLLGVLLSIVDFCRRNGILKTSGVVFLVLILVFGPLLAVYRQVNINSPGDSRLLLVPWLASAYFLASLFFRLKSMPVKLGMPVVAAIAIANVVASHATGRNILNRGDLSVVNKQFDSLSEYIVEKPQCHLVDEHNGWSSWAYDLQKVISPEQTEFWVVAPDRLLDFMVRSNSPVCNMNDDRIEFFRYTREVECDQSKEVAVKMNFDGANIALGFGPEKSGTYYLDVAGKYVLSLPPDFYGPFPNATRFEKFKVYRIFEDGSVGCTKDLHFNPNISHRLVEGRMK